MTLKQPLRGKPLDDNGAIAFEHQEAVTPTEQLADVLKRASYLEKKYGERVDCFRDHYFPPSTVILLLSLLEQAKREALKEAIKELCRKCEQGQPLDGRWHWWTQGVYKGKYHSECPAYLIHRKLAEQPEVKL